MYKKIDGCQKSMLVSDIISKWPNKFIVPAPYLMEPINCLQNEKLHCVIIEEWRPENRYHKIQLDKNDLIILHIDTAIHGEFYIWPGRYKCLACNIFSDKDICNDCRERIIEQARQRLKLKLRPKARRRIVC